MVSSSSARVYTFVRPITDISSGSRWKPKTMRLVSPGERRRGSAVANMPWCLVPRIKKGSISERKTLSLVYDETENEVMDSGFEEGLPTFAYIHKSGSPHARVKAKRATSETEGLRCPEYSLPQNVANAIPRLTTPEYFNKKSHADIYSPPFCQNSTTGSRK